MSVIGRPRQRRFLARPRPWLSLGPLDSLEEVREVVPRSSKPETLVPYATVSHTSFDRLTHLCVA